MNESPLHPSSDQRGSTLWGNDDPFELLPRMRGDPIRRFKNRRTLRFHSQGRPLYVKYHAPMPLGEILLSLLRGGAPTLDAEREWRALRRLQALNIPAPIPVSCARQGWLAHRRRSFIVTEAMDGTIDLETLSAGWATSPPNQREKRSLIKASAKIIRNMHDAGICHRDMYLCHLRLSMNSSPQAPQLALMDLHRARFRASAPTRWRVRDLGALLTSSAGRGLSARDMLRFAREYDAPRNLHEQSAFWAKVRHRAKRLQRRAERRARRR